MRGQEELGKLEYNKRFTYNISAERFGVFYA